MKRFAVTGLLALAALAGSVGEARAHHWCHDCNFGFQFNIGFSLGFGFTHGPVDCCPTKPVYPMLPPHAGMDFGGVPYAGVVHPGVGQFDPAQLQSGYYFPGQVGYGQAPNYWYEH